MRAGEIIEHGSPRSVCTKYFKGYQVTMNIAKKGGIENYVEGNDEQLNRNLSIF